MPTHERIACLTTGVIFGVLASWLTAGRMSCTDGGVRFHGRQQNVPAGPTGSCWCGDADSYCLCTPSLSVDVVVECCDEPGGRPKVALVRRRKPPLGWALAGGYVNLGETAEQAARREVKEETGLIASESGMVQLHLFTDPARDPRRHGASQLMAARVHGPCTVQAGDDAAHVRVFSVEEALSRPLTLGARGMLEAYARKDVAGCQAS